MALQEKQLGQLRPANTTAATLYSPGDNTTTIITNIWVCNTTGNTPTYRLFVDDNGTTYDETTAIAFDVALTANQSLRIPCFIAMNDSSGNLAVRTSANNEITFTCFGTEIT